MAARNFYVPGNHALNTNGIAIPGATASLYETGITTPVPFYSDIGLSVSLGTTITANGSGRFPNAYGDGSVAYRLILKDAEGATLDGGDIDPFYFGVVIYTLTGTGSISAADRTELASIIGISGSAAILAESGREGLFFWSDANLSTLVTADTQQGIYVAPTTDTTGASGAWVRKFSDSLNVMWFGAVADNATNAATAINATFRVAEAVAVTGSTNGTIYRGGPAVFIPKGKYYITATLEPLVTVRIHGDGGLGWGAATQIRSAAGVTALRAQSYNTSGAGTVDIVTHYAGDRLIIQDIYFLGAFTATEAEAHGCHAKREINLERCTFDNFEGDGLYIDASVGGGAPTEGNANVSRAYNCDFANNRNGISTEGDDANALMILGGSIGGNRRWGIKEDSFLGNHYFGCHFDANGFGAWNTGSATQPCSYVSHGGNIYFAIHGQETGASTNAPSGTTADNTWWGFWQVGAPAAARPAWVSGITVRSGGPLLINGLNNASTIYGSHSESNGINQVDQYGYVDSGSTMIGATVLVTGGVLGRNRGNILGPTQAGLKAFGNLIVAGDLTAMSSTNVLGPASGASPADGTTYFGSRGTGHALSFYVFDASGNVTTNIGSYIWGSGFGATCDLTNGGHFHRWKVGGSEYFKVDNSGVIVTGAAAVSGAITAASVAATGAMTSSGTAGIGYATGAGGTIAQITNRTTGVTLNKVSGAITLFSAAGTATWQTFTVTNSTVAATDTVIVNQKSGTDLNMIHVTAVAAGSFNISFATTGGTTVEQPVFNFNVIKGVAA